MYWRPSSTSATRRIPSTTPSRGGPCSHPIPGSARWRPKMAGLPQPRPSRDLQDYWMTERNGAPDASVEGAWVFRVPTELADLWWDRIRHVAFRGRLGPVVAITTALRPPGV